MIAVTYPGSRKRARPDVEGGTLLAVSPLNEQAWYFPPCEFDGPQAGRTATGEDWIPAFLKSGRMTMFVAGNPGAGKSYLAKEMIMSLPRSYKVLLFTALSEDDGNFEEIGEGRLFKVRMEPDNLKNITLDAIRARCDNCILLFDDIDKIRDKAVEKLTFAIMEDALANGRQHRTHDGRGDIHVIATSHALNDYKKTKYTLENSDYVALFPGSTTKAQYDRMFSKLGLSQELCDETYDKGKRGEVRSVIIHKSAPMYIIAGDTIQLI